MAFTLHPIVTILIAIGPAVYSLWRGRDLLRDLDDPALPERLLASHRSHGSVAGVSIGLLLFTSFGRLAWAIPLLIVARMLAAYPVRKALHNETWSVWGYLSFYLRLIVAAFGFWLLVAAAPAIAASAGSRDWIAAIVLAAILIVWNAYYVKSFRSLLSAVPVETPSIRSRFEQLANACGLPNVALDQVKLHGGSFTNAVAIPSTRTPAVVVTDTLLNRFDEDEVTAILAHELAHHEQFTHARLRQANLAAWLFISVGALLSPLTRLAELPGFMLLLWPVTVVAGVILRMQQRQKYETESDLRAVALTRDPEALVRALTKLHESARIPRRWDAEFERRATHPSLARRIQAIRRASGVEPPSLTEPAAFAGANSTASVAFHGNRLEWHEGASMTHAVHYRSLRELRIDVRSSSAPVLVAVDSAARRWTISLQASDIARVQSVLDVIDVQLGKADAPSASMPFTVKGLLTLLVIVGGMAVGQLAVLVTGALALIQPASQVAAAAGVSALVAAGFALRDRTLWGVSELGVGVPMTLALSGAALVVVAFASRRDAPRGIATTKMVAGLALLAALGWAIVGLLGTSAIDFHRNIREWPSVAVLTFASAGALAFASSQRLRWGSLATAMAGLVAAYGSSTDFVDRFVTDPFVTTAPAVNVQTPAASPVNEFTIDGFPSSLVLSPAGKYLALTTEDAHENSTIHAGRAGGSLASFSADEAVFFSESRLLLLERQEQASVLRLIELAEGNREVWTLNVPVRRADLSIDRSSLTWRLLGWNAGDDIASAEGQVGTQAIQQFQWSAPGDVHDLTPLGMSHGTVIALETRQQFPTASATHLFPLWPYLWTLRRAESSLWSLSDRGAVIFATSNAELTCHSSSTIDEPPTCAAFDGTRTRFVAVDGKTQRLTAHAAITGRLYASGTDYGDWLNGWWDQTPVALHAKTRKVFQFSDRAGERPYQIAMGSSAIAGVFPGGRTFTIRIYAIPQTSL